MPSSSDVSAVPILIDTKDVDEFVDTVIRIAPGFGGIHLEDISAPECFEIERRLIEALPQPVMHDDVHGTAVVTMAAAIAACRQVGHPPRRGGRRPDRPGRGGLRDRLADPRRRGQAGHRHRPQPMGAGAGARARDRDRGPRDRDGRGRRGRRHHRTAGADHPRPRAPRPGHPGAHQSRPGDRARRWRSQAGAAFAADGTSVNNVLGYPGIFRGALLAGASAINIEHEASRRLGAGRPDGRVRARPRRARPQRPRDGGTGGTPGGHRQWRLGSGPDRSRAVTSAPGADWKPADYHAMFPVFGTICDQAGIDL